MSVDTLLDVPFINFILSVIIVVEATFAFALRWTRPRSSSRAQSMLGVFALVALGLLGVVTGFAQVWQVANDSVLPALSVITSLAVLLRLTAIVSLATWIWHEWKENGHQD